MVGQAHQIGLRFLYRGDIREHRHVVTDLAFGVGNRANCLPLRVNFTAFASIPDLAMPITVVLQ